MQRFQPKPILTSTELWYTPAIDKACIDADLAKRQYKANKSANNKKQWHCLQNKANELIKYAKANYYGPKLNPRLGSKRLWNNAKDMGLVTSKKITSRPNFTADEFNSHVTVSKDQPQAPLQITHAQTRSYTGRHTHFAFRNVTEDEIVLALWSVEVH